MSPLNLSLLVNVCLLVAKLAAGVSTGSAVLIAESIHSVLDVLSAIFALTALKLKKEHLAKYSEATLLTFGCLWVVSEIVDRQHTVTEPQLGILVCILSLVCYTFTYKHNHHHGHSEAVRANLVHLASDIGATGITLVSLCLIYVTGWVWLDKVVAVIIVLWLLYLAFELLSSSLSLRRFRSTRSEE